MPRRKFSETDTILTLAYQGFVVTCFRCKEPLVYNTALSGEQLYLPTVRIEREHLHELALGGADGPHNCRYSHTYCHKLITNGTKATTAGSSKQRIAKTKRLIEGKKPTKHPLRSRNSLKRTDGVKYK